MIRVEFFVFTWKIANRVERKSKKSKRACSSIRDFRVGPLRVLWQVILDVESSDLSQADKSFIRVSSFSILQNFNFWMTKFTVIPKKTIWHLAIWKNWCFGQFFVYKFARLKSKYFFQFLWWEVNLRGLRAFILQTVVERQKKKFCYPSLSFEKETLL